MKIFEDTPGEANKRRRTGLIKQRSSAREPDSHPEQVGNDRAVFDRNAGFAVMCAAPHRARRFTFSFEIPELSFIRMFLAHCTDLSNHVSQPILLNIRCVLPPERAGNYCFAKLITSNKSDSRDVVERGGACGGPDGRQHKETTSCLRATP